MEITYDQAKNERNIRERGLSFERAEHFDFGSAIYSIDTRQDYGERRIVALGYLDRRLHSLCFINTETGIRVISFRKANRREARQYGRSRTLD